MIENDPLDDEIEVFGSRSSFIVFVLLTIAGFLGLDILTPCCFRDALPALFLMTLVVGQLTLICVWGTLVEGTFWIRLPWTALLLVVSWAALCFGVYLDNGLITPAEVMGMGLVWFYGFAVSFVPLKIAAWLFGWKIWFVGEDRAAETQGRYGIRDMMVGTSVLALALAIGRAFIPGELPSWSQVLRASGLESYEALLALFLFSIISLVVKLPCIWIALATPRDKVVSRSGFWILCSAGLGCVETVLLAVLVGITGSELGEILLGLVAGHAAMAALMIVVLYGLRSFGYRMTRQRTVIRVAD